MRRRIEPTLLPLAFLAVVLSAAAATDAAGQDGAEPNSNGAIDPNGNADGSVVRYKLSQASGRPGDIVDVVLEVTSEVPLKAVSVAVTFDARLLRAENVIRGPRFQDDVAAAPDGLLEVRINNPPLEAVIDPATPDIPTDQGFVFLKLESADDTLLFSERQPVLSFILQFAILPPPEDLELPVVSPIRFEAIGPFPAPPGGADDVLENVVEEPAGAQRNVIPDDLNDGGVMILGLGEIGFFRRADANLDCAVDVSDSLFTFGFLFRGLPHPTCEDAADSNDDGVMDLSDGIFTLQWLFVSGREPPEPVVFGPDPTPDDLHCIGAPDPCS